MDKKIDIIDNEEKIIGTALISDLNIDNSLKHREVILIIKNSKNEFLMQKRNDSNPIFPGYYSLCDGIVLSGESYDDAVERLQEEYGIDDGKIEFLITIDITSKYSIRAGIYLVDCENIKINNNSRFFLTGDPNSIMFGFDFLPEHRMIFEKFKEMIGIKYEKSNSAGIGSPEDRRSWRV